jgi:hypothetical protein
MTQSTPERKPCGTCGNEYTVTANGTIRHHFTDNPDFQASPDSRKCRGVGQPPAGAAPADAHQCRLCKHPVVLTSNGRARSHLTPEAVPRPCPGGSDFPLGTYPDITGTTDGLVATLARDCGHVPAGECYGCYGAAGNPVSDSELRALEEAQGTGAAPWGVDADAVTQPTMADQLKASPLTEALEREVRSTGTVLDVMDGDTRAEAERFMAAANAAPAVKVLEQRAPEVTHEYTDPSGTKWVHPGTEDACQAPDCVTMRQAAGNGGLMDIYGRYKTGGVYCEQCNTDTHRCPGCGTDVRHGTVACDDCDRRVTANRIPPGETDDGRPCHHDDAMFGVEDDRMVCVACGTPCTHPDGFTENDPEEDDGEGLVYRCGLCGSVDGGESVGPDDPQAREVGATLAALNAEQAKADDWRTPAKDVRELMPEDVQGLDSLRLNCIDCGHPVTPLVDQFDLYGKAKAVAWACEPGIRSVYRVCRDHECKPDTNARLGDLEHGDHFIRRGTLMRATSVGYGVVEAVVVDGPMKGRTGELKNPDEIVERTHCRHSFTYADDGKFGHSGSFCDYCGIDESDPRTTEQETKECPDDKTAMRQPRSSAAAEGSATAAPVPGSPPATTANAAPAAPSSSPATSSAPTATAAGKDRSAAVTTDESAAAAAFLAGGRPSAPAGTQGTGARNQTDAAAQFLAGGSGAHGEKETKRDRYGRYLIPHPDTGKEQAWTRATTFAKSISDTYALSQWGLRMALLGATMRPDLVRRAHGKHVRADKKLLDELTAELKDAAGAKVAANDGTAMHSFTELADRAWHSPGGPRSVMDQVPPDCRAMVETYISLLEETGLEPVADLIEFTTVVKQYGVAGTSDNCYRLTKPLMLKIGRAEVQLLPGEYVIGDKKTGRDLDYGWQEHAIQLSTYAQGINTSGVWDRHEEKWHPDPLNGAKVRTDAGVIIHLPVDPESEKTPTVYGLDLESGWNAAVLCERVRAWRNVRKLASPVMVSEAADTFAPARPEPQVTTRTTVRPPTLLEKAQAVTSKGEASAVWQEATQAGLPTSEVDKLVDVMQARLRELAEPGG